MQSTVVTNESLLKIVERLENAVSKLEGKAIQPVVQAPIPQINVGTAILTTEKIVANTEYWNKTLKHLLELKAAATETGAPEIEQISEGVCEAICAQQDVLIATETFKKPVNNDLKSLQKKLFSFAVKIEDIGKSKPDFVLHAGAVKDGLDALNWLYSDDSCDMITQTFLESIDFKGNKIFMKKIPTHTKWVKAFKAIINEIDLFVKANHKSGLIWASKGDGDISNLLLTIGNTCRKNFKNQSQPQEEVIETTVTATTTTTETTSTSSSSTATTTTSNTKQLNPSIAAIKQAEMKAGAALKIQEMITSGTIRNSLKPVTKTEEKKEAPKEEVVETKKEEAPKIQAVHVVAPKKDKKPTVTRVEEKLS